MGDRRYGILGWILTVWLLTSCVWAGWPFSIGNYGSDSGEACCVDWLDHTIVAFRFQNTVNCSPGASALYLHAEGDFDTGLMECKADSDLVWGIRIGGVGAITVPHAVECDGFGNVYVAGAFGVDGAATTRTVDFDPDSVSHYYVSTQGDLDGYLAKYNTSGELVWALGLGNPQASTDERVWDIGVDDSGVFVTGAFHGSVEFNPLGTTSNVVSLSGGDAGLFLARYDTNGINQWALGVEANITDVPNHGYSAVDADGTGGCWWGGNFLGTSVEFNPLGGSSAPLSSEGDVDIFFGHYDSVGACDWVYRLGGTGTDILSPGAMRADGAGRLAMTGRIDGSGDFDPGAGTHLIASFAGYNTFLASYTDAGVLRWAHSLQGGGGLDGGSRVGFDADGNVFVAGWFTDQVDFDPGESKAYRLYANGTGADAFLGMYGCDAGDVVWVRHFGADSASQVNAALGLAVDGSQNAIVTGEFFSTDVDFDPLAGKEELDSAGQGDCFTSKYTRDGYLWEASGGPTIFHEHQQVSITSTGGNYSGVWAFGWSSWISFADTTGDHDLTYVLPSEEMWLGTYVYDYATFSWTEAFHAYREFLE